MPAPHASLDMPAAPAHRASCRAARLGTARTAARTTLAVTATALLGGCAGITETVGAMPAGAVPAPRTPAGGDGLISVGAVSNTVRPERRDFSEALLGQLRVPAGFRVSVFARDLENPRGMAAAASGDVYVAEREAGRVRLLRDTDGDGRADVSTVVAEGIGEGMEGVHGLAIRDGRLYMVTVNELYSAPVMADGALGERTLHIDDLPDGGQHPNRTLAWGPDGFLYVSVGSQTNGVPEPDDRTATMLRVNPENWEYEIFAEGLRNTIGFGWHPVSGNLYGLDHNTDHRGDDWPPEEVNQIIEGRHYGWPFCGGDREVDWHVAPNPDGDEPRQQFCARTEPPVLTYIAHAAPMQMVYYTGDQFPAEYRNDAFVTMRGSWNRNPPIGYEVVRIRFNAQGQPTAMEPFISGWLIENGAAHFGRLMGMAQAVDGALLVGDDTNGVIYRVAYTGE
jgi:glucose/arabinose dehydrogenase